MIWIIGGIFLLLLMAVIAYSNKKVAKVIDELSFFKKAKSYNEEAILQFTDTNKIIFANSAAKNLFLLNSKNEFSIAQNKINLKTEHSVAKNFFELLKNTEVDKEHIASIKNATLVILGKIKEVNILIDKSEWKDKKTITAIIHTDMATNGSDVQKESMGSVDFLTALPSQFSAIKDINNAIVKEADSPKAFSVLVLGIDHFEDIQSTLGLEYTNQILKRIGQYFVNNPEENTKVYRMEHNKFLLHIKGLENEEEARHIAKKTLHLVSNIFRDNRQITLTASMGIAIYPDDGANAMKMIDSAYIALNKAQEKGVLSIEKFTQIEKNILNNELSINDEIEDGLRKKEFELYYQPIFDLNGDILMGAEALIRWNHPTKGMLSADKFLNIAEKTGHIFELSQYIFDEAIRTRQAWSTYVHKNFTITINVSLKELQINKLLPKLDILFEKYKVEKHTINLDVSEKTAMENIEKTIQDFQQLKDFGLSLSLEHFGAGYSSLKHLGQLPIDRIKIDRALISDLTSSISHQTTVKAIIELGHILGYEVAAEGVENSQEASILKMLKCNYAQGYLYAAPLSLVDFEILLA